MDYRVLILTSGTGSRMGELTKNTNKALLPIHGRPAIDYILERYDPQIEVVVTLGYLGDQVQEALLKNHPERTFHFATVDPYEGPGSSQNYSTLQARSFLNMPFIFHSCDTIVTDAIPAPTENWVAGFHMEGDLRQYRTHRMENGRLARILDKGEPGFETIHVGLVGVHDHESFWINMQRLHDANPNDMTQNDTIVVNEMLKEGKTFRMIPLSNWYDTGNPQAMEKTERAFTRKQI